MDVYEHVHHNQNLTINLEHVAYLEYYRGSATLKVGLSGGREFALAFPNETDAAQQYSELQSLLKRVRTR